MEEETGKQWSNVEKRQRKGRGRKEGVKREETEEVFARVGGGWWDIRQREGAEKKGTSFLEFIEFFKVQMNRKHSAACV